MKRIKRLCLLIAAVLLGMIFLNSCALFHEHKFSEWEITKEASCIANGEKKKACKCGEAEIKIIKATGHTPGAEATCTTAQTCAVCNEELVKALGHKAGEKATCTKAQTCTVCNEELVKALGHQAGAEATCTKAQTCTVCNEELVKALGHQAGAEATCTKAQTCTVCNEELVKALGHQAGAEATCTTAQTCTVCKEELVKALGHQAGAEATCTKAQTCTVCNEELVKALGHQAGAEATCTTAQTCTVCKEELKEALGHKAGKKATCTTAQTCTVCNEELAKALGHQAGAEATCTKAQTCTVCNEELVKALGHQAGTEATCTKAQLCTVCDKQLVKALGHKAGEKATCTTAQTCTVCKEELKEALGHKASKKATCTTAQTCTVCNEELIKALGHQAGAEATCTKAQTCTVCNEELKKALGHNGVIDASVTPTCTESGWTEGKHCDRCDTTLVDQTEIPPLGHQYNDGEVITEATCMQSGVKKYTCNILSCLHSYTDAYELPNYTAEEIFDYALQYTGKITAYDPSGTERSVGTGFVLSSDGKIVTNYRVIEGAYSADITINNIKYPIVSVLSYDTERDLAVLKIDAVNLIPVTICKNPVAIGETVYAVGFSKGLTLSCSQGIVADGERTINGVSYVRHDASVTNGYAGGPLINIYGEVIGIHAVGIDDSQKLTFSVLIEALDCMEYGTPTTLQHLYEQKVKSYQEELDALTSEYNEAIAKLQLAIAACQTNIENCLKNIEYANIQKASLSPSCPQWFIQQYLQKWQSYGSTAAAERAAKSAWSQEYNRQVSSLNQTISTNREAMEASQAELSQYEDQAEALDSQYDEAVKALQAKYGMEE